VEYPGCGEGVDNMSSDKRIDIFPNPATTSITILSTNQPVNEIAITNLIGQTLFIHNYNTPQVQIDISKLHSGLYFVKVNGSEVRKLCKE